MELRDIREQLEGYKGKIRKSHSSEADIANKIAADFAASEIGGDGTGLVSCGGTIYCYDKSTGAWFDVDQTIFQSIIQLYGMLDVVQTKFSANGERTDINGRLMLTNSKIVGIHKCALTNPEILDPHYFDKPRHGIAFRNAFVTVAKEGGDDGVDVIPNSPDHRVRHSIEYEFDPDAEYDEFLNALRECFEQDPDCEDKILAMQEFLGACLIGVAPDYNRCMLLIGGGNNGKSSIMEVIRGALFPTTEDAVAAVPPHMFSEQYYQTMIRKCMINICNEIPESDILQSSVFKSIITGDRVVGRDPYGRPFTFAPKCGHIFSGNNLPGTIDSTHGFWRRFLVIPFNRVFNEPGTATRPEFISHMLRHKQGIMNWALRGAVRLLRQGEYTVPKGHITAMDDWQLDANPVAAFVRETCRKCVDAASGDYLSTIYGAFKEWSIKKQRKPTTDRTLAKRLRNLGYYSLRHGQGTKFNIEVKMVAEWENW